MALLDRLINGFVRGLRTFAGPFDDVFLALAVLANQDMTEDEVKARIVDDLTPVDELAEGSVDAVEEFIVGPIQQEGELTPENVEGVIDEAEGNAAGLLLNIAGVGLATEIGSVGQVDTMAGEITQALAGLGIDDVTGTELQVRLEQGALPALEAKVAKENVPQFVSLQDAVEFALRQKESDEGWLRGDTAPQEAVDRIGSNQPVDPNNLLEEWGIRPDQLPVLEEVALEAVEIEELIESPVQFGVVPTPEEAEDVLQISGLPESTKDLFRRTIEQAPRTADLWEQRSTTGELVPELDTLVLDGEIDPDQALGLLPDEAEDAVPALRDRWELFGELPPKSPTRSQVEGSFTTGFTDLDTLEDRLERLDVDPDRYPDIVDEVIFGDIDGGLQEAFALGFITEGQYGSLMDRIGLDADAQEALMSGQGIGDVVDRRLEEAADPAELPVSSVPGIGQSRAAGLRAEEIETVADLAAAEIDTVATATQVSLLQATQFINTARTRTDQQPIEPPQAAAEAAGFTLEDLSTVNDAEAALLRQQGLTDVEAVAAADEETVAEVLGIGTQTAREIIAQAIQETS